MKNLTSIALATLLVGCVAGDNEAPDDPQPDPDAERVQFPKSCAQKAIGNATLPDGEYSSAPRRPSSSAGGSRP